MRTLNTPLLTLISTIVNASTCDCFGSAADYLDQHLQKGVKAASINDFGSATPEPFATFVLLFILANTAGFACGIGITAGNAVLITMAPEKAT